MSVPEVAAYINGTEQWVRKLIADHQLKAFRIRGKWYVDKESVELLVAEQKAADGNDTELQSQLAERRRKRNEVEPGRATYDQVPLFTEE